MAGSGRNPDKIAPFCEEHGLRNGDAFDGVVIADHTASHATHTLDAVNAGKPVLVIKPLVTTVDDSEPLYTAAAEKGVLAAILTLFARTERRWWFRELPGWSGLVRTPFPPAIQRLGRHVCPAHLAGRHVLAFDPVVSGVFSLLLNVSPADSFEAVPDRADDQQQNEYF